MPQLDLMSFFPQIFWCFGCFFGFYFYFSFLIIPKIATILKFRKKKLLSLAHGINTKKDSSSYLLVEYDNMLRQSFQEIKNLLDKVVSLGHTWISTNVYKLNTTTLVTVNKRFLNSACYKEVKLTQTFKKKRKK